MGEGTVGGEVNWDGRVDYRVPQGYGALRVQSRVGIDVNRDIRVDYRTSTRVKPGPELALGRGGY